MPRPSADPTPARGAAPVPSRRALAAALAISLAGVAVALWLARLHVRAHAGFTSACAINETFNCDRVATSPWSVLLGLPVAVWGVLGFGTAAVLAALGLAKRRAHAGWPTGLLFLVSVAAVAASVALALVSELLIGSFCVVCAAAWTLSILLLVAAWRAVRGVGVGASVRADLAVLAARPARTAAVALAGVAVVAVLAAVYPRYWNKPPPTQAAAEGATPGAPPGADAGAASAASAAAAQSPSDKVIVEFSDYLCPFCADAHVQVRRKLAGRTDVTLVHRHFPLDPTCNPVVKRMIHPGACELAKAGICAEAQNRGTEMDDLIFANQRARRPVEDLAREVGLDLTVFRECLASPATDRRLAADIQNGVAVGIRATPTFVAGGKVYSGELPPVLAGGGDPTR